MRKEPRGKFIQDKLVKLGQTELSPAEHAEATRQTALANDELPKELEQFNKSQPLADGQ